MVFFQKRTASLSTCGGDDVVRLWSGSRRHREKPFIDRCKFGGRQTCLQIGLHALDMRVAGREQVFATFGQVEMLDASMDGVWPADERAAALEVGDDHTDCRCREAGNPGDLRIRRADILGQKTQHQKLRRRHVKIGQRLIDLEGDVRRPPVGAGNPAAGGPRRRRVMVDPQAMP